MEKLILKKRLRTVAIGTQWLHELRQAQVQALQVRRSLFGPFLVHIVAGGAANIADSRMPRILVKDRHFARRIREYRAPDVLRPGDDI